MISELSPGTLITNRYLIQKTLGQGGFGRTYLAYDTQRFDDPCVLKEFVPATTKEQILNKSIELFEREAKVLYQLQHPQIPKFLACLRENQQLFIVQEYIDGNTYSQILYARISGKGKPFSETEVRVWLLDMLPVLEYIHERKIIHRDISLENVMLRRNESKPILIDFGVVKEKFTQILSCDPLNSQYSVLGSAVGKFGYSPPEQLRLGHCYPSSDIYALGVCAIVLLTGKMPYLLIDDSLNWRWRSYVNISDSLASILEKMLAELPSDRYQSAPEIILELHHKPQTVPAGMVANQSPKLGLLNFFRKQEKQKTAKNEELLALQQLTQKLNPETETTTELHPQAPVSLNPEFLEYCQRELTSFIGPCASVLIKHTLQKAPQIAPKEFIEALAAAVPDPQRAQDFKKSIKLPAEPNSQKLQNSFNPKEPIGNYPAISDPEFLENCRRELNGFVGPFGSVILQQTLAYQPNLTPKQLIETLVAEIPNPQRAQKFRERFNKLHLS